jgi:16S rRNA (cytidine1402-2'-O)-methyltransferase
VDHGPELEMSDQPPDTGFGFNQDVDSNASTNLHRNMITPGALYIVATPIGNLRDISLRALDILAAVDMIAAEDTRITHHLLKAYSIPGQVMALHQHNERRGAEKLIGLLAAGKTAAFVTDAGTPGISDPGASLVKLVREQGHEVVPVPGANAAICALSASGIAASPFIFYGFLPAGSGSRRREIARLKTQPYTLIFYEAPHRVLECVEDLAAILGGHRELIIARELTKLFETMHSCCLGEACAWLHADANRQKGEFVLLVSGAEAKNESGLSEKAQHILALLMKELSLAQAVRLAAEITGESRNMIYSHALTLKRPDGP